MDLYTSFQLPPPPPPTWLSRDRSFSRARFPDFQTADDVESFLWMIVAWPRPQWTYEFLQFQIGCNLLFTLVIAALVGYKIRDRSLWLFRFCLRPQGKVLIPNLHIVWIMLQGLFGLGLIGIYFETFYFWKKELPFSHRGITYAVLWSPICFACWYQTWAINSADFTHRQQAAASSVRASHVSEGTVLGRHRIPATAANIFNLTLPLVPTLTCVYLGLLSDHHFEDAGAKWTRWVAEYSNATALNHEMLLDAQQIWTAELRGAYYYSTVFLVWAIACILFWGFYILSACRLIGKLYGHLRSTPTRNAPAAGLYASRLSFRAPGACRLPKQSIKGSVSCQRTFSDDTVTIDGFQSSAAITTTPAMSTITHSDLEKNPSSMGSTVFRTDSPPSFLPAVRSLTLIERVSQTQEHKALFYFTMQTVTVFLGGCGFIAILLAVVIEAYPSSESGHPERFETPAWITLSILLLFLAAATAVCSMYHIFEAVLSMFVRRSNFFTARGSDDPTGRVSA